MLSLTLRPTPKAKDESLPCFLLGKTGNLQSDWKADGSGDQNIKKRRQGLENYCDSDIKKKSIPSI